MDAKEFQILRGQIDAYMPMVSEHLFNADDPNVHDRIAQWGKSLESVDFGIAAEVISEMAEGTRPRPEPWADILTELCSEQRRRKDLEERQNHRNEDRAKYSRETAAKDQTPFQERFGMSMLEKFKEVTGTPNQTTGVNTHAKNASR